MTIESAKSTADAAQVAIKNLQSEMFLAKLRDQGFSGVKMVSTMVKVRSVSRMFDYIDFESAGLSYALRDI